MLEVDAQLLVDVHREAGAVEAGDRVSAGVDVRDSEVSLGDGDRSLTDRAAGKRVPRLERRQRCEAAEPEPTSGSALLCDERGRRAEAFFCGRAGSPTRNCVPAGEPEGGLAEREPETDDADAPLAPHRGL